MPPKIHLLVDSTGWSTPLDPDMVSVVLSARLPAHFPVQLVADELSERWYEVLPIGEAIVFLFLTRPLSGDWQPPVKQWLSPQHRLYLLHTDAVGTNDLRLLAQLTVGQPVARAAYRVAQQNSAGLDNAANWMAGLLTKLIDVHAILHTRPNDDLPAEAVMMPARFTPTRWRSLPSNRQDADYYPDQLASSAQGAGGYGLAAASLRGKSHAHAGTFRDDAVALATTSYWNIMAVADGAGTAPLARVGSNLAVKSAVEAMYAAMPQMPANEDVGKAIWAGLRAAYNAIRDFAAQRQIDVSNLHTTLQLLIHWPQKTGCLVGVAHVGDGIIAAETTDRQFYLLTEPDLDPDEDGRTLFLTSGSLRTWMEERTKIYQFDEPLEMVCLMTDGVSGDLEPYTELLPSNLFEALRQRVLCYPLKQREQALLAFVSYDRRGSFDDRTLAVLARE